MLQKLNNHQSSAVATLSLGILALSQANSANPKLIPIIRLPTLLPQLGDPIIH
jgi:hypothetical protein